MKKKISAAFGGLTAAALITLTGCGSATESASPATIQALDTRNYQTLPPVTTTPPTSAPTSDDEATAGDTTTEETTHTVQPNESLPIIAKKYGIELQDLLDLNGFDSAAHVIHPGDKIKIPAGAKVIDSGDDEDDDSIGNPGSGSEGDGEKETDSDGGCTYTIKAGDNPSKVAEKVGISLEDLRAANPESVMSTFLVGAELIIPPPGEC